MGLQIKETASETPVSSKDALTHGYDNQVNGGRITSLASQTGEKSTQALQDGVQKLDSNSTQIKEQFSLQGKDLYKSVGEIVGGGKTPDLRLGTTSNGPVDGAIDGPIDGPVLPQEPKPEDPNNPYDSNKTDPNKPSNPKDLHDPNNPKDPKPANIDNNFGVKYDIPKSTLELMSKDGFSTLEGKISTTSGKGTDFKAYIGTDGKLIGVTFNNGDQLITLEAIEKSGIKLGKLGVEANVGQYVTAFANMYFGDKLVGANAGFDATYNFKTLKSNTGTTNFSANAGAQATFGATFDGLKDKKFSSVYEVHGNIKAQYQSDDKNLNIVNSLTYSNEFVPGQQPSWGNLAFKSQASNYIPSSTTLIYGDVGGNINQQGYAVGGKAGVTKYVTGYDSVNARGGIDLKSNMGKQVTSWNADAGVSHNFKDGSGKIGGGVFTGGEIGGNGLNNGLYAEIEKKANENLSIFGKGSVNTMGNWKAGAGINYNF